MFDAVVVVGPGYKAPTFAELRGPLHQDENTDCTARLVEFRASWEHTGSTVMSDGWTDQKGRTLLNFLVSCPKETMFMKFVDASAHIKDARLLCELLDIFIQEVGPSNVVQVIMDNAANYVAAGKMLMERYPNLFWTPCAAHCIDLMLKDIGKIPIVRDIVESSKSITKFIYSHASVLSLMRRFTNNKKLVRPAITRFATTFIYLQSLLNSMWDVKSMFLSADWCSLSISHKPEGEGICRLVSYDQNFWAGLEEVCAISEPLVRVLRLVDGDKPARATCMRLCIGPKKPFVLIMQIRETRGVYLNLAFSYACGFRFDAEVMDGFFTCVEKMVSSELESQRFNDMVYVYYNLRLWVRQRQKPTDVEAISLDNIDTTSSWSVETKRPIMDSIPDWLGVDLEDVAVAEEREPEIEEEEQH
eukprot:PITA_03827